MATALEELKDSFVKDLLENYIELDKAIKAIPDDLTASLEAVKVVISNLPDQVDDKLKERLLDIDNLHDQLKKITEDKANESIELLNNLASEKEGKLKEEFNNLNSLAERNKVEFNEYIKSSFDSTVSELKKTQTTNNNYLLAISASVSFFFVGALASFFIFSNSNEVRQVQEEYNKYIEITNNSLNELPPNCKIIFDNSFKKALNKKD